MKRSVEEIRQDILAHLKWDNRLNSSDIHVDIVGNTVKLSGFIKSVMEKSAAENDVRSIPGVIKVENNLEIRLEGYEKHSDEQIGWNVKSVLILNSQINSLGIEVSVNKGTVILKGSVDQYWKKVHITDIVHMVPGVLNVVNTLAVVHSTIPYDKAIAQDIIEAFERIGTINPENITVEVEGGRVVLKGKVSDWYSYSSAHNIVKFTRGVTDLINNLIISE
jgi:osmotically-inducible protein OsmY